MLNVSPTLESERLRRRFHCDDGRVLPANQFQQACVRPPPATTSRFKHDCLTAPDTKLSWLSSAFVFWPLIYQCLKVIGFGGIDTVFSNFCASSFERAASGFPKRHFI